MNLDQYLTLGVDWEFGMCLTGWCASEKQDGCRALWDGQNLWSRGGRIIPIPGSIRAALPDGVRLDGEVHGGRGGFKAAVAAVLHGHWTPAIRFTVFDCPDHPGSWPQRLAESSRLYADCVSFTVCEDFQHANAMLLEVQGGQGEGLVFRHPTALGYVRGRSRHFVKVKGVIYEI